MQMKVERAKRWQRYQKSILYHYILSTSVLGRMRHGLANFVINLFNHALVHRRIRFPSWLNYHINLEMKVLPLLLNVRYLWLINGEIGWALQSGEIVRAPQKLGEKGCRLDGFMTMKLSSGLAITDFLPERRESHLPHRLRLEFEAWVWIWGMIW